MPDEAMLDVEMFGMRTVSAMEDSANGVDVFGDGDVMHVVGQRQ